MNFPLAQKLSKLYKDSLNKKIYRRSYMNLSIQKFLMYFGIALFPFQILSITLGSRYDFSAILLLIFVFLLNLKISRSRNFFKIPKKISYSLIIFLILQLFLFLFSETPLYRFISGLIWFGGLFTIYLSRKDINIDFSLTYKIIFIVIFFSSVVMLFEFFTSKARPMAFFDEPSYAGLVLYSMSAAYLGCLIIGKDLLVRKKHLLIYAFYFFFVALLTKSLHIFSFFIVLFLITIKLIFDSKNSIKLKNFINILFAFFIILIIFFNVGDLNHFIFNLRFNDLANASQSLLTWLYGMDQAFEAIKLNPFTGLGVGATGFFDFHSSYYPLLEKITNSSHNKTDSFSGLFRLIIEFGIFFPIVLILTITFNILNINNIKKEFNKRYKLNFEILFIRIFSSTMFIGILIKEPTYSRSIVYITVLLFFTSFISCKSFNMLTIKNFIKKI